MQTGEFIEGLRRDFLLTTYDLKKIVRDFHAEMRRGLAGGRSSLKMLPSYIDCAAGRELGQFLAIDLGGTNLRAMRIKLCGNGVAKTDRVRKFRIPESASHGRGKDLFDFIAKSIRAFSKKNDIVQRLGLTFSFPFEQAGPASGKLIGWTKGFSATGVVGEDITSLLRNAFRRNDIEGISIAALVNDAVGTLMAGSYADTRCDIAAIFGTGTNACYREKISNIDKLKKDHRHSGDRMIINVEWGNFDRLPLNQYDLALDAETTNQKCQLLEKMISGMYLNKIVIRIIEDMIRQKIIFDGRTPVHLIKHFGTGDMAAIESDSTRGLVRVKSILKRLGITNSSLDERSAMKDACRIASGRAARISASVLYAIITWIDPKVASGHTPAIDGTLFEKYPEFRGRISAALRELHPKKSSNIKILHVKGGSGLGAAIAAAAVTKNPQLILR